MSQTTCFHQYTQPVERRIANKLLETIFATEGRTVRVSDGEATFGPFSNPYDVRKELATTGENWITIFEGKRRIGAVWLIWGNGEDLISDYSDNPDTRAIVDPLLDMDFR